MRIVFDVLKNVCSGSECPLTHSQISSVFDYIFKMLDGYAHELVAATHMSNELLQDIEAFIDSQRARGAKLSSSRGGVYAFSLYVTFTFSPFTKSKSTVMYCIVKSILRFLVFQSTSPYQDPGLRVSLRRTFESRRPHAEAELAA